MNELELFEQRPVDDTTSTMTTKELADSLGVSVDSIQNAVKKLAEKNRQVFLMIKRNNQGGYLFNEAQVTAKGMVWLEKKIKAA